jgi:hypothetical protein
MSCILFSEPVAPSCWCPIFAPIFSRPSRWSEISDFPFLPAGCCHPSFLHGLFMLVFWFWPMLWLESRRCCEFYPAECRQWCTLGSSFPLLLIGFWWWLFPLLLRSWLRIISDLKFYVALSRLLCVPMGLSHISKRSIINLRSRSTLIAPAEDLIVIRGTGGIDYRRTRYTVLCNVVFNFSLVI